MSLDYEFYTEIEKIMIVISNTLSGKKEAFTPLKPKAVSLYVCGITPYDYAHLGHGRVYVTFDVLYRLLRFLGYTVTYCRNFTDIDDKIIARAQKEYNDANSYTKISEKFIETYHQDMQALNCLPPTYEPKVTQTIPEIIAFVQGLIDAGKAYELDGDVYFELAAFPEYGALSKHKLEDLHAGARVEIDLRKKSPLDFALWKKSETGEPGWQSPWGLGRPGWHIECSAMAEKFLGKTIDIHAGGLDLIFPHHENEIAQSQGLHNAPFVKYWMHNGFVRINQEKMSKSLGNFFTLRDIFKKYDPMVVRFYLLSHHYKAPLDFSFEDLDMVQKSYQRLCKVFAGVDGSICSPKLATHHERDNQPFVPSNVAQQCISRDKLLKSETVKNMLKFLADDLNTPGMFGVVFEALPQLQKNPQELLLVKDFLQTVLGLTMLPLPEKEVVMTPEIESLLSAREQARKNKEWARADELREQLRSLGYEVQDKK